MRARKAPIVDPLLFDQAVRQVGIQASRRMALHVLVTGVASAAAITRPSSADAKKKKKKNCAKKCLNGCCTSPKGKCIQPAQQSATRCGVGGAICQSIGCPECKADRACSTGECCRGDETCGACLVFVSSSLYTGNLGGLTGADAKCQALADVAGLPGTYLAWLSEASASPSTRFIRATVPYTLVSGTKVANGWSGLTGSTLIHSIDVTEFGVNSGSDDIGVWTNTRSDGLPKSVTGAGRCTEWTSAAVAQLGYVGMTTSTSSSWTDSAPVQCSALFRIFCFQQK